MKTCSVCLTKFESDSPAILTMSGFGNPRHLCPECEELIDKLNASRDRATAKEIYEELIKHISLSNADDPVVMKALDEIFSETKERIEAIENGTYVEPEEDIPYRDGSDEIPSEESDGGEEKAEFDIPEELRESEEDRALDEIEARKNKIFDTVIGWASAAILVGALVFFILKFVF